MTQIIKLAWRNIWRKNKRSIIVIISVAFAIIITTSMRSLQLGSYDKMIEAAVKNSGYVQVHTKGYWKDKSINDLLLEDESTKQKINSVNDVTAIIPRLQNFALAAGQNTSKASMVFGIDPSAENNFNNLSKRVTKGNYINKNSTGVMIAEGLAKIPKTKIERYIGSYRARLSSKHCIRQIQN